MIDCSRTHARLAERKPFLEALIQLGYPGTAGSDELVLSALNAPSPLDDDRPFSASIETADTALGSLDGHAPVGIDVLSGRDAKTENLANAVLDRLKTQLAELSSSPPTRPP